MAVAVFALCDGSALLSAHAVLTRFLQFVAPGEAVSAVPVGLFAFSGIVLAGLHASLRLWPGYLLHPEERFRRGTLAVVGAVATAGMGGLLLSGTDATGLAVMAAFLVLAALVGAALSELSARALNRIGLWGMPSEVIADPELRPEVERALRMNWRYGLVPASDALPSHRRRPTSRIGTAAVCTG